MKDIKTIGVIGAKGMVGHTVYRYFKEKGAEVYGYSNSDRKEEEKVNNADLVFICVPTPYRWERAKGFDASIIDEVLAKLEDGAIAVIKSTVTIGTTNGFQKKYPKLNLMFNPEFLSEDTCWEDFIRPDRQFVGYTKKSYFYATQVLNLLPESPYDLICPVKEAELLKYINNLHGILEVMESNHYYDVCQREGLDYDRVIKAAISSKWVGCAMGRHYHVIFHKGFRGVGGKCFPKDINAWIDYCNDRGINVKFLGVVRDENKRLLKEQGLTEKDAENITSEEDFNKLKK